MVLEGGFVEIKCKSLSIKNPQVEVTVEFCISFLHKIIQNEIAYLSVSCLNYSLRYSHFPLSIPLPSHHVQGVAMQPYFNSLIEYNYSNS